MTTGIVRYSQTKVPFNSSEIRFVVGKKNALTGGKTNREEQTENDGLGCDQCQRQIVFHFFQGTLDGSYCVEILEENIIDEARKNQLLNSTFPVPWDAFNLGNEKLFRFLVPEENVSTKTNRSYFFALLYVLINIQHFTDLYC